ncbi:MAG TPA: hypothetical protein VMT24_17030 [Aggregatilineaceae bacterium]|nr:hypothetical protein [Aggregatilineaceae bacterium]
MTTEMIIIAIFCYVDDQMRTITKHPQAKLYPSELVTIGLLLALKGGHFRAFFRWLKRDYDGLFGGLPDRTRLLRALEAHSVWTQLFLAAPSLFTVGDSYPIELLFPIREGRSPKQVGKKGKDKGRWTIGGRWWVLLDTYGRIVVWYWRPLDHPDKDFNCFVRYRDGLTITLTDLGFRDTDGVPANLKRCPKGTWNERMVVASVFSMLTVVCQLKTIYHRVRDYIFMRLGLVAALFNTLDALFHQLHPEHSQFKLSIAEFSL